MTELTSYALYAGAIGLLAIGIAGVLLCHHVFRVVLALGIAEAGANLLLVLTGFRWDGTAPIIENGIQGHMVDPVPQALVLTSIVIGVGVQALALALAVRLRQAYGTLDLREIRVRMERDLDAQAGVAPPASQEEPAGGRPLPPPVAPPLIASREARP
jgi:multisubunit Na+/H+ antiporter MnhC subunit